MSYTVEVITLTPSVWPVLLSDASGLVGRAFQRGLASLTVSDLRDFGRGAHRQVDDTPFGGGAGMVLQVEPVHRAIERARSRTPGPVVLLSPGGARFSQAWAKGLAANAGLTLVCGRYEGFDERVRSYVDLEISIGDYVLSSGDPAAWCVIDACVRLLPGVLGNPESVVDESFARGGLEYPHYTRPAVYEQQVVPEVLRSGDHAAIAAWRQTMAAERTARNRPDIAAGHNEDEPGSSS